MKTYETKGIINSNFKKYIGYFYWKNLTNDSAFLNRRFLKFRDSEILITQLKDGYRITGFIISKFMEKEFNQRWYEQVGSIIVDTYELTSVSLLKLLIESKNEILQSDIQEEFKDILEENNYE